MKVAIIMLISIVLIYFIVDMVDVSIKEEQ
jgi:hypothetical protein